MFDLGFPVSGKTLIKAFTFSLPESVELELAGESPLKGNDCCVIILEASELRWSRAQSQPAQDRRYVRFMHRGLCCKRGTQVVV